jgi:hypothetical protein
MTRSGYDVSGHKGLTTNSLVQVKYLYGGKTNFSKVSAQFYNDIFRVGLQRSLGFNYKLFKYAILSRHHSQPLPASNADINWQSAVSTAKASVQHTTVHCNNYPYVRRHGNT